MMRDADVSLSQYITRVREIPTISREDEHDLALRVRDLQDPVASEKLVRANMRYVVSIALTYRRYDLKLSDLISEGNVGLVTAVKKFDPEKGTRFVTYAAYWIRAFMLNYVIKSWSLVGSGSGPLRSKMFFRLRREKARIGGMAEKAQGAMEALAVEMGLSPERLAEMMHRLDGRDVSLDIAAFPDSGTTALDLLEDPGAPQDERLGDHEHGAILGGRVHGAMLSLDARERFIVEQRMMSDEEMSLAELGRRLGVSRERARQLEARAKKKLRMSLADLQTESSAVEQHG